MASIAARNAQNYFIRIVMIKFIILIGIILLVFTVYPSDLEAQDSDTLLLKNAVISFQQKDYPKVREFALKALEIKPNYGEAYILIGMAYVSSVNCVLIAIFIRTHYRLAVDMFEKAIQVDSSVTEKAN